MKNKKIYITQSDLYRLREMIKKRIFGREADRLALDEMNRLSDSDAVSSWLREARRRNDPGHEAEWTRIEELEAELNRAVIIAPDQVAADVITMNSKVCLKDVDTNKEESYELVYPEDADIEQNKISILAPIGTAILGYKVGDIIEWKVPAGLRKFKIQKILYQPEAAKEYYL